MTKWLSSKKRFTALSSRVNDVNLPIRNRLQAKLFWGLFALICVMLTGTIGYKLIGGAEHTWFDGFYMTFITVATIGYGDLTPTTPLAKAFTIVYVINGIVILLAFFDRIRIVRVQRIETSAKKPE